MFRVIKIVDDGVEILTRSRRVYHWETVPVFTKDPTDKRIVEYGTVSGALKRMAQLMRDGICVRVVNADTGIEIEESKEVREVTAHGQSNKAKD